MTAAEPPGPNPVTLFYRHVVQARAQVLFAGRGRVLDLGATRGAALAQIRDSEGAFALPGDLDAHEDMAALGRALSAALRSAAPVLLAIPRPMRLADVRTALGPAFDWHGGFAVGVLASEERRQAWVRRHPQAFGFLAAAERLVRRWPLVRDAGQYRVIEGSRRTAGAVQLDVAF